MIASERNVTSGTEDIDLGALWRVLWGYKYFIAVVAMLAAVAAAVVGLLATPMYRAEVTIAQVTDERMSGLAALAGQFGGLASLAGINLTDATGMREAKAVLESRRLVEEFIRRNALMPTLYPDQPNPPSMWFAVKRFRESVRAIRENARSGLTIVAIEWTDPAVAARWANDFVALANDVIRTKELDAAKRNIAYLEEQAAATNVIELRAVMFKLIENETKTMMLASGKSEYAFTIVDPAVAPEVRSSPRRTLMVLAGVLLGGFLGVVLAFCLDAWRRHRRDAAVAS